MAARKKAKADPVTENEKIEQPEVAETPVEKSVIAKAKTKPKTIGNAREQGPCRVAGIELAAKGEKGDSVELTLDQLQNQNFLSLIARNIGSGLLEWR